jgi:hypothetical protein
LNGIICQPPFHAQVVDELISQNIGLSAHGQPFIPSQSDSTIWTMENAAGQ